MKVFKHKEIIYIKERDGSYTPATYLFRFWFFTWWAYLEISYNCFQERDYAQENHSYLYSRLISKSDLPVAANVYAAQYSFEDACKNHPRGIGRFRQ